MQQPFESHCLIPLFMSYTHYQSIIIKHKCIVRYQRSIHEVQVIRSETSIDLILWKQSSDFLFLLLVERIWFVEAYFWLIKTLSNFARDIPTAFCLLHRKSRCQFFLKIKAKICFCNKVWGYDHIRKNV